MEYLITFTDGSDAFLAHHGVKGMKWGVWNEETKARYGNVPVQGGGGVIDEEDEEKERSLEEIGKGISEIMLCERTEENYKKELQTYSSTKDFFSSSKTYDEKDYKKWRREIDDYYGKNGKEAQDKEIKRRKKAIKECNKILEEIQTAREEQEKQKSS